MNHKQQHTLDAILTDPVSGNIHWKDVESLLNALGAELAKSRGAKQHVALNGMEGVVHRPHHSGAMSKQEVRHLRDFLHSAGY